MRAALAAAGVVTAAGADPRWPRARECWWPGWSRTGSGRNDRLRQGVTFINLEDETGLINVICSAGAWKRYRRVARSSPALVIDGRLERVETVINVIAESGSGLCRSVGGRLCSRDFRRGCRRFTAAFPASPAGFYPAGRHCLHALQSGKSKRRGPQQGVKTHPVGPRQLRRAHWSLLSRGRQFVPGSLHQVDGLDCHLDRLGCHLDRLDRLDCHLDRLDRLDVGFQKASSASSQGLQASSTPVTSSNGSASVTSGGS